MYRELFRLAVQGLKVRKRSTLLLFVVLFLSLSLAVVTLSVAGSITKTNRLYRRDTYGDWEMSIISGLPEDEEFLRSAEWMDKLGIARKVGTVAVSSARNIFNVGTANSEYLEVGRVRAEKGRLPQAAGEIALEREMLEALGYAPEVGQEITLAIIPRYTHFTAGAVSRTFTVTGILRSYTGTWKIEQNREGVKLCSALITEADAQAILTEAADLAAAQRLKGQELVEEAKANGEEPSLYTEAMTRAEVAPLNCQYFFTIREGARLQADGELRQYLFNARLNTHLDRVPSVNKELESDGTEKEAAVNYAYTVLIFAATLLAVLCIYALQMQKQVRQIALFRSIGITKRQLRVMLFCETACICLPAMALGLAAGALGTWAVLRLAVYAGAVDVVVDLPVRLLIPAILLWLAGILLSRLLVFQTAVRGRLTGRMGMEREKARRVRTSQRAVTALLGVLLCATVFFTVMEGAGPLTELESWRGLATFSAIGSWGNVGLEGYSQYGENAVYSTTPANFSSFAQRIIEQAIRDIRADKQAAAQEAGEEYDPETDDDPRLTKAYWAGMPLHLNQLTDETIDSLLAIPGVTGVTAQGYLNAELTETGLEDSPYYRKAEERDKTKNEISLKNDRVRVGYLHGVAVDLCFFPENEWESRFDTGLVDLDAFRRGDEVLVAAQVNDRGEYLLQYPVVTGENAVTHKAEYRTETACFPDVGLEEGDELTLRFYNSSSKTGKMVQSVGEMTVRVGGVMQVPEGLTDPAYSYVPESGGYAVVCSLAFIERVLKDSDPYYSIQGSYVTTPNPVDLGYSSVQVHTALGAGYLSTNAKVLTLLDKDSWYVTDRFQEHMERGQALIQELVMVVLAGACVAIVLSLIMGNTLALEAEREQRSFGILQAVGLSRRQLFGRLTGAALGRGLLAAAGGWAVFLGYGAYRAGHVIREFYLLEETGELITLGEGLDSGQLKYYAGQVIGGIPTQVTLPFREGAQALMESYRAAGMTPGALALLTGAGIALVVGISLLTKYRLFREDLMGKLRDE